MRIAQISVAAQSDAWKAVGFPVSATGSIDLSNCEILFNEPDGSPCIESWTLEGRGPGDIGGIPTMWLSEGPTSGPGGGSANVKRLDHIMVQASDPSSFLDSVAALGGVDRSPAGGASTSPSIVLGGVRVDVLQGDEATMAGAVLFGLAFEVDGLFALVEQLGPDVIGATKPATQEGWFVSAFRSGAGLGIPCALMSRS